ncbi:MAG: hypothetical protein CMH56_08245 [Myxococcales bacterium]|nr:hypothetical protein [Myxococcales bacterium]|tara:strand:+ start:998 stop:1855 length:858 start_codon:yes stop_codon:yes gene_type:complete
MRFSGLIILMGLFFTMGCVTSLSMQNGPFALNKGEHEVFASGGWTGHSQVLTTSYAAGEDLWQQAQGEKQLSEEEFRNLLDAGLGWLLFFPGFNAEFAYRTGLPNFGWPKWDVGVRTDGQVLKYDLRMQFFEDGAQWKHAAALNVGHGVHMGIVNETLSYVSLTDFTRHDLDMQLSYGLRYDEYFEFYANPRFLVSYVDAESKLPADLMAKMPESLQEYDPSQFFQDVWLTYVGGGLGIRGGYKYAFVFAEASLLWLTFQPEVFGETRDLSGLALTPRIGLMARF